MERLHDRHTEAVRGPIHAGTEQGERIVDVDNVRAVPPQGIGHVLITRRRPDGPHPRQRHIHSAVCVTFLGRRNQLFHIVSALLQERLFFGNDRVFPAQAGLVPIMNL